MTIRPVQPDDVPRLIEMGLEFHRFAECERWGLGFDVVDLAETIGELATSEESCCLVAENADGIIGVIAGVMIPWYLRRADVIAQEVWFWVDPDQRATGAGRALLDAFEAWGLDNGASVVQLATPGPDRLEPVISRLWRRWGYSRVETAWARRL